MHELSVFVDESGDYGEYRPHSPFYIITMVFHDQTFSIDCTFELIELKMNQGRISNTDSYFFGNFKALKKNYLSKIKKMRCE